MAGLVILLAASWLRAEPAKNSPLASLSNSPKDALAGSLRGYLVSHLPVVLYEARPGWDHQEKTPIRKVLKNEGEWRRMVVTAYNLPDSLIFDIRKVNPSSNGPTTFDVFVSLDTRVEYVRQNWRVGIKTFDTSVKARLRIKMNLTFEATTRLESTGSLIPDVVFRLRVLKANVAYDNLEVEHVAGMGGEMARILGDTAKGALSQFYPSLERELIAKANAAIVKAGDTKEVRLGLSNLLK